MSQGFESRTWKFTTTHQARELKLSTTTHDTGVYHVLMIAGKGARGWFELDDEAMAALVAAFSTIEQNPGIVQDFVISRDLTLSCAPPRLALVNCQVQFPFRDGEHLRQLADRLVEADLIRQLALRLKSPAGTG